MRGFRDNRVNNKIAKKASNSVEEKGVSGGGVKAHPPRSFRFGHLGAGGTEKSSSKTVTSAESTSSLSLPGRREDDDNRQRNMQVPYYSSSVEKPTGPNHSLIGSVGAMVGSWRQWSGGVNPEGNPEASDPTMDGNNNGLVAMEAAFHQRFATMVQEKDEQIQQLEYKLRLREEAIEQLEQNILMQQESSEMIRQELERTQSNGGKKSSRDDDDDSDNGYNMEEEEMKETIEHLRKQLRGKNDAYSTLSRTSSAQQLQIDRLEAELEVMQQQVESADTTAEEMKEILNGLQAKLLDKNTTNAALVRSAKQQSDTASKLRAEIERLQETALQAKESHANEMQELEDKLNDMHLQFSEMVVKKHGDDQSRASTTSEASYVSQDLQDMLNGATNGIPAARATTPPPKHHDDRSRASTNSEASYVSQDLQDMLKGATNGIPVARARTPSPPPTAPMYQTGHWAQTYSTPGRSDHDDFSSDSGDEFSIYSDEGSVDHGR